MARRIHVKGDYRHEEDVAAGTISPGMLIEYTSAGKVQAHPTEGGYAEIAIAEEDALQGNTVDDDYTSDDVVSYMLPVRGAVVYGLVKSGEDIAKGDKLISAGDGAFIKNGSEASGTTVKQIVGYAMETQDLTASGASNTLTKIRIA